MSTPPYAKILVSVNAGGNASGKVVAPSAATIQLAGENTSGWITQRWEFYGYPPGWTAPAGWSTDANNVIFSTAVTPPLFTLPANTVTWGKWLPRLTVNGGIDPLGAANATRMMDTATGISMASPQGFLDLASQETSQFGTSWVTDFQTNLRKMDTLLAGISVSGQQAGDLLEFNGTNWVPVHAAADGKILTATGPAASPIWNYWHDESFPWGAMGSCVMVMDPANATLSGSNVQTLVDSGPIHLAAVSPANNLTLDGDGGPASPGVAQFVASDSNFNGYPSIDFNGHNCRYTIAANTGLMIGDSHNFGIPGYAAAGAKLLDYTLFFAVHLSAVASASSSGIWTYPALWSGNNGTVTTPGASANFSSGNLVAVAGYEPSGGGAMVASQASIPFAVGQTKVIAQRYRASDTTLSIRDGVGAWATVSTPAVGASNVQLIGQPCVGANDAASFSGSDTRFFDGQLAYFAAYRMALTDNQVLSAVKNLLGRFRL